MGVAGDFLALGFLSKANCAGSRTGDDGLISINAMDGISQFVKA